MSLLLSHYVDEHWKVQVLHFWLLLYRHISQYLSHCKMVNMTVVQYVD